MFFFMHFINTNITTLTERYHWAQYQCHTMWPLHIRRNSHQGRNWRDH